MIDSTLILTILTTCVCLYYFILNKLLHFKGLKITHMQPIPLLSNMASIFQRMSLADNVHRIYDLFPKYFNFYDLTPVYVIQISSPLLPSKALTTFASSQLYERKWGNDQQCLVYEAMFGAKCESFSVLVLHLTQDENDIRFSMRVRR